MDLWLSDVVPGPPDGAPQVVAVTGRMITLTWNPPRSLDMAIGVSDPHGTEWWDGGMGRAGSGKGAKEARMGGQGPRKHTGWGMDRVRGAWLEAALTASSVWWMELRVRRGQREPPHFRLFLRGTGCLGRAPGNMLFFPVYDLFLLAASVSPLKQ